MRRARSYKGGGPNDQALTTTTLTKPINNTDPTGTWTVGSSRFDNISDQANNQLQHDMSVINIPPTATSVGYHNIYSCNSVNAQSMATGVKPFTGDAYMSFKILPMNPAAGNYCPTLTVPTTLPPQANNYYMDSFGSFTVPMNKPDKTLKNCVIGLAQVDSTYAGGLFEVLNINKAAAYAYLIQGDINTTKGRVWPNSRVARGNNINASKAPLGSNLDWNASMVFNIIYTAGKMLFYLNDVLVDTYAYTLPAGKVLVPFHTSWYIPSGPQMITNVCVGSIIPSDSTTDDPKNPAKMLAVALAASAAAGQKLYQSVSSAATTISSPSFSKVLTILKKYAGVGGRRGHSRRARRVYRKKTARSKGAGRVNRQKRGRA